MIYDLIVIGAGPAGCATAISAAPTSAKAAAVSSIHCGK